MNRELKLSVPTYYGTANCKQNVVGHPPDFDEPTVPILIQEADGVRIILGTHDFNDLEKPDIQIERRPKGWAIFLHPVAGDDASGYVYFLDDGRSFLLKENWLNRSGCIEVLSTGEEPSEIDEIELPQPDIIGPTTVDRPGTRTVPVASVTKVERIEDPEASVMKKCARCKHRVESSDDWYGDLCPACADETDCDWVCPVCGRRSTFEAMGGDGAADAVCCGAPCQRVEGDEPPSETDASS